MRSVETYVETCFEKYGAQTGTPTVSAPQAAAVQLSPSAVSIIVGTDYQLTAVVVDGSGGAIPGQTVSWNSINPPVASVTQTGKVYGVSVGTALVTAVFGNHLSVDTVHVTPAP